ncbi:conserved hypothetical protein [Beggiatoa sp. PS]|nr:conserved hypothetical protein [Beggiatoa sp. PS]
MDIKNKVKEDLNIAIQSQNSDTIRNALENIISNRELNRIIEYIYTDKGDFIKSISNSSYFHQLGFSKIILMGGKYPSWRLRLHVWNYDKAPDWSDIHNHSWDFYSVIFSGELLTKFYDVSDDGEKYEHYKYGINKNGCFSIKPIGTNKLKQVESLSYKFGNTYFLDKDILHSVLVPAGITCSLMLHLPCEKKYSDMYRKGIFKEIQNKNKTTDINELRVILKKVNEILKNN